MENEVQKNLNENITPFWEYYMPHAREVSELRNVEKELIIKFVDRYNKQFIPIKFQFKEIENCYMWTYEKDSIDLKVTILNVTELAVTLKCEHNGKSKELEIIEPPYMATVEITEPPYADVYNTVYQFLVEAFKNSIELVELESKMKF